MITLYKDYDENVDQIGWYWIDEIHDQIDEINDFKLIHTKWGFSKGHMTMVHDIWHLMNIVNATRLIEIKSINIVNDIKLIK